jgi:putative DNA primase/helicase
LKDLVYEADNARDPDQYGHQIKGTTADWQRAVAIPLRGNSNVALSLATSFASALIPFADEQRGGVHLFGVTGIGKTAVLAVGESVYGLPGASEHPRSYGRTWAITPTGLEDLLRFRNHAGFFLDELQRVPRENRGLVVQMIYAFTQVQKARGGSWRLQGDGAGQVFLLSSGEDPIATFVGKREDREGRERRMPDIPAEVRDGSAFETIARDALREKLPAFYQTMIKQCHGASGRDWQMWLVELGAVKIKERIDRERLVFLALPQVQGIERRAQPQLRSIIRRFALYAASLRMAIEANVLPWTFEEADAGLIACLERWVKQRGNLDTSG